MMMSKHQLLGGGYAPQPTTQQSTASEYFTPDEEDLDAAYDEDDSESEAEQARQWDIMEELVERLSTIVETRPKNISADALIAELRNELRTVDKNVYEKFQESISAHLTELIYAHLSIDLSGAELRRLWAVAAYLYSPRSHSFNFHLKKVIDDLFKKKRQQLTMLLLLNLIAITVVAQDGNAGITEATSKVKGYFSAGTNLMYAVGAIVGLVGAVKVLINGIQETPTLIKSQRHGLEAAFSWWLLPPFSNPSSAYKPPPVILFMAISNYNINKGIINR